MMRESWTLPGGLRDWTVFLLVAATFLIASFCLISLSWDGSYVLYTAAQDGTPMLPHGRYASWLFMWPVAGLARVWSGPPWVFAVLQGVMYGLPVVVSFGVMLRMTRERPVQRLWGLWGVLLWALPGQLCITMEGLPVTQLILPVALYFWTGCPRPWLWVPWVFGAFCFFLHPSASPLLVLAGVGGLYAAGRSASAASKAAGLALVAAGVGKIFQTWMTATPYEQGQMSVGVLHRELLGAVFLTPFLMLIPLFFDSLACVFLPKLSGSPRYRNWSRLLWVLGAGIGVGMALYPLGWSGALLYRKAAFLLVSALLILGSWQAKRPRTVVDFPRLQSGLVVIWAVVFLLISVQWRRQCSWLAHALKERSEGLSTVGALGLRPNSVLDHWSIFTTSLFLQNRQPTRAAFREEGRIEGGDVYLFSGDDPPLKMGGLTFDLRRLPLVIDAPEKSE